MCRIRRTFHSRGFYLQSVFHLASGTLLGKESEEETMIILICVAFLALLLYSVLIFKPKNFPPGKSYAVEERLAFMCTNGYAYFKLFVYLYIYFSAVSRN